MGSRIPQRTVGFEEKEEEEEEKKKMMMMVVVVVVVVTTMNKPMNMNMNFAALRHLLFVNDSSFHIRSLSREKQIIANYARV